MNTDKPLIAFLVVVTIAFVCSVLVSVSAIGLRPIQERNALIERSRNIVALSGLVEPGVSLSGDEILAAVEQMEVRVLNIDTGEFDDGIDVTEFDPQRRYYLWHDRAVFHFMIDPDSVHRYLDTLRTALVPGGHFVIATFGPEGPDQCSGLPVQRYSVDSLANLLQDDFEVRSFEIQDHVTPTGTVQQFLYAWWQAKT